MSMLIMDGLMVSLLIMAIAFCWRLNGRVQNIKEVGQEFKPFMKNLSSYLGQISAQISKLKETSEHTHKTLGQQLPHGVKLKDDFDVMIEHGEKLADRLEHILEKAYQIERQLNEMVYRTQRNGGQHFQNAVTQHQPYEQHAYYARPYQNQPHPQEESPTSLQTQRTEPIAPSNPDLASIIKGMR